MKKPEKLTFPEELEKEYRKMTFKATIISVILGIIIALAKILSDIYGF